MFQKLKKKLKDQRGMTLIELLAVIVILAIISAIAIPSILGLIDNSKKDSVVANAQQMINSAKLAVAGDEDLRPNATDKKIIYVNLAFLEGDGYLEPIKDVDKTSVLYSEGSTSNKTSLTTKPVKQSYVQIELDGDKTYKYAVTLIGDQKSIGQTTAVAENGLKRSVVLDTVPTP